MADLCSLQGGKNNLASEDWASVSVWNSSFSSISVCCFLFLFCLFCSVLSFLFFLVFFLVKATCASSMWWLRGEKQEIMFSCWCWFVAVWFAGWFWEHCQCHIFFSVGPKLSLLRQPRWLSFLSFLLFRWFLVFLSVVFSFVRVAAAPSPSQTETACLHFFFYCFCFLKVCYVSCLHSFFSGSTRETEKALHIVSWLFVCLCFVCGIAGRSS